MFHNCNMSIYSKELIGMLEKEDSIFQKVFWSYRSNWRILHIDGLEGGRKLKVSLGKIRNMMS